MDRAETLTTKHEQSGEPDVRSLAEFGPSSKDHGKEQGSIMLPDVPQQDFSREQFAQTTKSTQDLLRSTMVISQRKEDDGVQHAGSSAEETDEIQENPGETTAEETKGQEGEQVVHPVAAPTGKRDRGKRKEVLDEAENTTAGDVEEVPSATAVATDDEGKGKGKVLVSPAKEVPAEEVPVEEVPAEEVPAQETEQSAPAAPKGNPGTSKKRPKTKYKPLLLDGTPLPRPAPYYL